MSKTFKWHAVKKNGLSAYNMNSRLGTNDHVWTMLRVPEGSVYVWYDGISIGVDKRAELPAVQARVDRIASSLGHSPKE